MNKKFGSRVLNFFLLGILIVNLTGCSFLEDILHTTSGDVEDISAQASGEEQSEVESISTDKYAYSVLDDEAKQVYDEMLDTILSFGESIELSTTDKSVMETAYQAVMSDYGGLFWMSGYSYMEYTNTSDEVVKLEFKPKYTMTQDEKDSYETQVEDAAEVYLSECSEMTTDYEKVKYIFESLIDNVEYVEGSQENQNILSVFLYKQTVCQGYASAMQYLLTQLNIPCIVVTGEADGVSHAWNLVKMDGEYYYIDTTWGNSSYSMETDENGAYTNYAYFGITTQQLLANHIPDMKFDLPECTATADNYFIHEGMYFDSWNPEAVGNVFAEAYANGTENCSVQFANADLYSEALDYFITNQHITDYCGGLTTIRYIEDPSMNVITLEFS